MFYEKGMHLWDVNYTDKHGNKKCVRYCAKSKEDARRLYRSEEERGDVLVSIEKVKDNKHGK